MSNPLLKHGLLAGTRRESAPTTARAGAPRQMPQWHSASELPSTPDFYLVRERVGPRELTRRVLFSGHFWMSDTPVAAWREPTISEATLLESSAVSQLASKLIEDDPTGTGQPFAKSIEGLALTPLDESQPSQEMQSLKKLASLDLRIEVVRFLKPADGAEGITTGRVLSVSENYSAQHAGANRVVVHENKNLPRPLTPGESVSLEYRGGKVYAYDGIAHDINIVAPWMPQEQQGYLRRVMFDALSAMGKPQADDVRLRDAMCYALEATARHFGASETNLHQADIRLVVNELEAVVKPAEPAAAPPQQASAPPAPRRMRMR